MYSYFHTDSVAFVLDPETGCISYQYHVVFDGKLPKVSFMREGTIISNLEDLVQQISREIMPKTIDLGDTCFMPDLEYNPREVPNKKPLVSSYSNKTTV